ncbi:MAG: hypothetical protein E7543_05230 [Ruminococcaceae bacterium]|nr:hypothetical protein [Oscillospiraceae bacterium]
MSGFIKTIAAVIATVIAFFGITLTTDEDLPIDEKNGGDPFIVEYEGEAYYTYTTGGGVDIVKIEAFNDATELDRKVVMWSGENGTVGDVWAPEIHKIGDRWYIIAAALFDKNAVPKGAMPIGGPDKDDNDYYRYAFVLESGSEDIMSDYTFKGILAPNGLNNIDGTYLQKDGKLYYVCSAYRDVGNQALYICEMENPYTLKGEAVEISYPKYSWEKRGWPVNEGPAVLYHGEDTFIVYSASGFSSDHYCMGMLTLKGDDVMDKNSWKKSPFRVSYHRPLKEIYNAGHCSFLYRENGDIYTVFHATRELEFDNTPRLTYVQKLEFKCGKPAFQ